MSAISTDQASSAPDQRDDPFTSTGGGSGNHRFSHFDSQKFALGSTTSPENVKRSLEAHLAETERRIQEASNLGTTLLRQRTDLADRLRDVEKQQNEQDLTPELRQKLVDIEREYNEVGRDTARAFLPKSRVASSDVTGSPFAREGKVRCRSHLPLMNSSLIQPSVTSAPPSSKVKQPTHHRS